MHDTPVGADETKAIPSDASGAPVTGPQTSSGRYSAHYAAPAHRSRTQRRTSQRLILAVALVFTLIVLFFITVLYFSETTSLARVNQSLRADLTQREQELAQNRAQLEKAQQDLNNILLGRYPQLHKLERDKVMSLNEGYLKNIVFTVVKQGGEQKHEYKLVMENTGRYEVRPDFTLVAIDRLGVQVAIDQVLHLPTLAAGETRSFSSALDLTLQGSIPEYFYINRRTSPAKESRPSFDPLLFGSEAPAEVEPRNVRPGAGG
jgi:hypothetical protein